MLTNAKYPIVMTRESGIGRTKYNQTLSLSLDRRSRLPKAPICSKNKLSIPVRSNKTRDAAS